LQEIVQEFSRCPDKRFPLLVFIEAWGFPHEHHACERIPYAKHYLGSAHLCQLATLAIMQGLAEFQEEHDGEVEQLKVQRILGGPTFLVNGREAWKKWLHTSPSVGEVRGGNHAIDETVRVRLPRLHD